MMKGTSAGEHGRSKVIYGRGFSGIEMSALHAAGPGCWSRSEVVRPRDEER